MAQEILEKYKAIVFDWDGTLVDTCGLILDAHNHARQYMGHEVWTMDDFLGQASKSAREYYPEVYGERSDEAMKVLYEYVEKHHLTYLKPMAGAFEMLELFKSHNIPMAVVSNKRHETLLIEAKTVEWAHYFESIIGAGHAARDKPAIDPLMMALEQMEGDLMPADILYLGDTETDLLCTQKAGCETVLIQSDKPRPDLVEKYNPKYAFFSLIEMLEDVTGHAVATNMSLEANKA